MAEKGMSVKLELLDDESIAVVTLNRPSARNAINEDLCHCLANIFRRLQTLENVRVAVLTGSGKSFSAGIDLQNPVNAVRQASMAPEDRQVNPIHAMEDFDRPIIGAVNGAAITGGFELALACDILIGSSRALFRDTHTIVGVVPCWGLSQRLSRVIGPMRARMVSLTASPIDARTAEAWGLLTKIVDDNSKDGKLIPASFSPLMCAAIDMARTIVSKNNIIVREYKETINNGYKLTLNDGLQLEQERALKQYAALGQQAISGRAGSALRSKL
jgi:enoyl-CoA hydratase